LYILLLPIISVVYTVNCTEWPYMCCSAVKKLLTHSLTPWCPRI